jgi:lactoylglutathione lyase
VDVRLGPATDDAAHRELRDSGVTPLDFDGQPTDEPVVIAGCPPRQFFRDPDNHLLEYIAMIADQPRPDLGVVRWDQWPGK